MKKQAAPSITLPLAALLCLLPTSLARAAHPFVTDDVGTTGPGGAEVEVQALGGWVPEHGAADVVASVALYVGLARALDLGLTAAYTAARPPAACTHGITQPAADLKWRALEPDGAAPGLALRLDYGASSGSCEGAATHDVGAVLLASWVAGAVEVHVNGGAARRELGEPTAHAVLLGAVAASAAAGQHVRVGAEVVAEGQLGHGAPTVSTQLGAAWELAPGRTLSVGVGPDKAPGHGLRWAATIGLTAGLGGRP